MKVEIPNSFLQELIKELHNLHHFLHDGEDVWWKTSLGKLHSLLLQHQSSETGRSKKIVKSNRGRIRRAFGRKKGDKEG
jgi:hypothetical protein